MGKYPPVDPDSLSHEDLAGLIVSAACSGKWEIAEGFKRETWT